MVDPTAVPVRFTKMTTQSFDLDVFSYVLTPDFNEFLKVQSELLLNILDRLSALGIVLAVPIEEMVVTGEQQREPHSFRQISPATPPSGTRSDIGMRFLRMTRKNATAATLIPKPAMASAA